VPASALVCLAQRRLNHHRGQRYLGGVGPVRDCP